MRNSIHWAVLGFCLSLIVACTAPEHQSTTEHTTGQHDAPIVQEQLNALKKAKDLSRTLQHAEAARQRQIEMETR